MRTLDTISGQKLFLDDEEYEIASQYQWQSKSDGRGGHRPVAYIAGKRISFAVLVFKLDKSQTIFHKNGNSFDFRKEHIVICTRSELGHFIGSSNIKLTRYKGVYYYERNHKWAVRIIKDGKLYDGGHYSSDDDAAIVADFLILKHFGADAERNHPEMTLQEIEERYIEILNKYGNSSNVRKANSGQGLIRCKEKTSKYIGVSRDKFKWTARIKHSKKQMHLGNFDTEEEAARAYDRKALELYGESAKLNFPHE